MSINTTSINYSSVAAVPWAKWEPGVKVQVLGCYTSKAVAQMAVKCLEVYKRKDLYSISIEEFRGEVVPFKGGDFMLKDISQGGEITIIRRSVNNGEKDQLKSGLKYFESQLKEPKRVRMIPSKDGLRLEVL